MTECKNALRWSPDMITDFWDFESNFPERYFTYKNGAEIVRQLKRYIRSPVLDFGSGPGFLLQELLDAGFFAAGSDLSPKTLEKLEQRFEGYPNFDGALRNLNNAKFATILAVELVEHLYDEPLKAVLGTLRNGLEPGGTLVVTTPNEEDLSRGMVLCPTTGQPFHRWQHVRSWSAESLERRLRDAGFSSVECFETNFSMGYTKRRSWWQAFKADRKLKGRKPRPHLVAIAKHD